MDITEQLRQQRIAKRLSQTALADRADLMRKHYQRIEVGRTSPTVNTLVRLADALGCEITLKPKDNGEDGRC